jgi:hypothetical protein
MFLSQPPIATMPSKPWQPTTVSIESAITSRETKEYFIPYTFMSNKRKYSSQVVDGYERAASRAMLYPVGFKKSDFSKPQVGIASTSH